MLTQSQVAEVIEQAGVEAFHQDPTKFLTGAAITEDDMIAAYLAGSYPYASGNAKWWGLEVVLNHEACQDIVNDKNGVTAKITAALAAVPEIGKILAALMALAFIACKARIKAVDNGTGVYVDIPWIILPTLFAPAPAIAYFLAALRANK